MRLTRWKECSGRQETSGVLEERRRGLRAGPVRSGPQLGDGIRYRGTRNAAAQMCERPRRQRAKQPRAFQRA